MYYPIYTFLDSIFLYIVENLLVCVHEGYGSEIFFSCSILI